MEIMKKSEDVYHSGECNMACDGKMDVTAEFQVDEHKTHAIMRMLNEQRTRNSCFCDARLVVQGDGYPVHKCILAANSDYFSTMFQANHFAEGHKKDIPLHGVNKNAVGVLLDVMYGDTLKLHVSNVYDVLSAADLFLMTTVKCFCIEFLLMVLKSANPHEEVLRVYKYGQLYSIPDLIHGAYHVIQDGFQKVCQTRQFLDLTFSELYDLVSADQLYEKEESVFMEAIIRWINADFLERQQYFDSLAEKVRFSLINPETLIVSIQKEKLMVKSERCQAFVEEAKLFHLLQNKQSRMQSARSKPRCDLDLVIIFMLAGCDNFKCYVPHYETWYSLSAPQAIEGVHSDTNSINMGVLCVEGMVYCTTNTGADDEVDKHTLVNLQKYSLETNEWVQCSLPPSIHCVTLIECQNQLYACTRLSLDVYNRTDNLWHSVTKWNLDPYQFVVSDDSTLFFINLVEGVTQEVKLGETLLVVIKQQILTPNQFVASILDVMKLRSHQVLITMRTLTGIKRKIYNVKSNQWKDASLHFGLLTINPKPGLHLPLCLDAGEFWSVAHDRDEDKLYVVGMRSGWCDVPPRNGATGQTLMDGVLPFFSVNMKTGEWIRRMALPEYLSQFTPRLCVHDNFSSMATKAF